MRLNLEVDKAQMDSLKALVERTGANSMKDLINNSLTILEWAADETSKGNEIAAVNEKTSVYRVLVIPLLQNVSKRDKKRILVSILMNSRLMT